MGEHQLYKKMCALLSDYNVMVARVENIDLDLARLPQIDTEEEAIEGMYYSRVQDGGPPAPGSVSDKTATVAMKWENEFWEVHADLALTKRSLEHEKRLLSRLLQKVDNAMGSLEPLQREIIKLFYVERRNWPQITVALHEKFRAYYTERHCRRLRAEAITYMVKVMYGVKIKETA